jgi:hypothetical protein
MTAPKTIEWKPIGNATDNPKQEQTSVTGKLELAGYATLDVSATANVQVAKVYRFVSKTAADG